MPAHPCPAPFRRPARLLSPLAALALLLTLLPLARPAPARAAEPLATARTATIFPADGATGLQFGQAVAVDGDTMVVAAAPRGAAPGAAYVYARGPGGAWSEAARLSTGAAYDSFGISAAIDGDTIVVGATQAIEAGQTRGAAYVYTRNQGGPGAWGLAARLVADDGAPGDSFGWSVAIDADTIAVGATRVDHYASPGVMLARELGAVYTFERGQGGDWAQSAKLSPPVIRSDNYFGVSLAIDGDTIVAGTHDRTMPRAHVFGRTPGAPASWAHAATLAPVGAVVAGFSWSVAVSGDTVAVGSPNSSGAYSESGAVFVYGRNADGDGDPSDGNAGEWGAAATLLPAEPRAEGGFGYALSAQGDTIAVGAHDYDDLEYPPYPTSLWGNGSVHVFSGGAGGWEETATLSEMAIGLDDPENNVGYSVAISGDTVVTSGDVGRRPAWRLPVHVYRLGVVGGPAARSQPAAATGASLSAADPPLSAGLLGTLTPSDGAAFTEFGYNLAIDGDIMVVGAHPSWLSFGESWTLSSGLAYIYQRLPDGTWAEVARLSSDDRADRFGDSVAVSGDTVVIGAPHANGRVAGAGAVYVFSRNQGGAGRWGLTARLMAGDGAHRDGLGVSVSIDGDTIVAGAPGAAGDVPRAGAVYTFERVGGAWAQDAKLLAPAQMRGGAFGTSVDIDSDTLVAAAVFQFFTGAVFDPSGGNTRGAAYVFGRGQGAPAGWALRARLGPDAGQDSSAFGVNVAISGDRAVVGSANDSRIATLSGAAYVFARGADADGDPADGNLDEWGKEQTLTVPGAAAYDTFGYAVDIDGGTVAASSHTLFSGPGKVRLFRAAGGAWEEVALFDEPAPHPGYSLALSGDTIAAGSQRGDTSADPVYVYRAVFPAAPALSGAPPAVGQYGAVYSHQLAATGAPAPGFSVTAGALPPGLDLSPSGLLSGVPAAAGSFGPITVTANNGVAPAASRTFSIAIAPAPLTVAAVSRTITAGEEIPALTYSAAGFVNGDSAAVLAGALATQATKGSPPGSYPITRGTLAAANYTIVFTPATLTIKPAPVIAERPPPIFLPLIIAR